MIHVLLADDHQIIRDGLKASLLLSDKGVEVVAEASNGKEAIEEISLRMAATQPVDVVVMDINMPDMDGLQATEYIHTHFPQVKVLVLSMVENEHLIAKAFQAGATGYVLKSVGSNELVHAIEIVATGERYVTTPIALALLEKVSGTESMAARPVTRKAEAAEANPAATLTPEDSVQLSKRETEVLQLIAKGYTNAKIAETLFTSKRTVENHRQNLLSKTGCSNTAMLIRYAVNHHLID